MCVQIIQFVTRLNEWMNEWQGWWRKKKILSSKEQTGKKLTFGLVLVLFLKLEKWLWVTGPK